MKIKRKNIKIGRDYGIRNVGHLAMRMLRIEKFIPFWAEELTSETNPIEVNKTFKVEFEKEHFIGKRALMRQKEEGVTKRLVQFHLENHDKDRDIWPWGGEAVYRNGEWAGVVSSTAYGFTLRKMVALGFVRHPGGATVVEEEWITDPSAKWTIAIAGKPFTASIHLEPPPLPVILQQESAQKKTKKSNYPTVQLLNTRRSSKQGSF